MLKYWTEGKGNKKNKPLTKGLIFTCKWNCGKRQNEKRINFNKEKADFWMNKDRLFGFLG
jgi:hypothetical protein